MSLKEKVREIVGRFDSSNATKISEIVDLIVCDYYEYDKHEIVELSKEIGYCLLETFDSHEISTPANAIQYLKDYYLSDD